MNRRAAVVAVGLMLFVTVVEGRVRQLSETLSWERLVVDDVERLFGWYAGEAVGADPVPVVLVLHGGGGSAAGAWSGDDGEAWRRLADDIGLVLMLPEGRSDPGKPEAHHWNDCRSDVLEPDAASEADDVGFLRAVVEWAATQWLLDRERIYVTGASNGGMMTFRMAMEAPDLMTAGAAIIANLPDPSECPGPFRAVPMLIMNGTEDPLMPWQGGCVAGARCERGTVLSTDDTVAFWIAVNRAQTLPSCTDLPDRAPDDGSVVTVCRHSRGVGGAEVVLYRIDGGGHSPPGPDPLPLWYRLIAGSKNHDISAADEIWAFFERHRGATRGPRRPSGRATR